jgi:hypothetical protein
MIKVEMIEDTATGVRSFFFQSSKPDDQEERDTLDKLLASLAGPDPRRGGFMLGSPGVLKIDVKIQE